MGLLVIAFGKPILGVFLTDPEVVALAWPPLVVAGLVIGIDTAGLVLLHALLGAGDTGRVMKISVIAQWLLFLPVAAVAGPVLGGGLLLIWVLQGLYRSGQTVWFAAAWRQGRWQHIKV